MRKSKKSFMFFKGVEVWVELEKLDHVLSFPFKYATILYADYVKGQVRVEYSDGVTENVKLERLLKYSNKESINVNDMAQVNLINKVDLLNNIKNRFDSKTIFTNVGQTLIIVNPYQQLKNTFSEERMDYFIKEAKAKTVTGYDKHTKFEPHIYEISMNTINNLMVYKKPQAIVISGESGAGKTETAKQAMKFITYYFRSEFHNDISLPESNIEEKILACNPVLESFGNSKTLRNDNSSRFGKYIKMFVDMKTKNIVGAFMVTYLLEKSRVCSLTNGERNYHIFYQIVKGVKVCIENNFEYDKIWNLLKVSEIVKANLKLKELLIQILNKEGIAYRLGVSDNIPINYSDFKYLINDVYEMDKVNDARNFVETLESMIKTGMEQEEIIKIVDITCAVLLMGNIDLEDNQQDEAIPCKLTEKGKFYLEKVSCLLQLDSFLLEKMLTINLRVMGKETIECPLKYKDSLTFRDTFAKEIYNRLFSYLIKKMNKNLFDSEVQSINDLHVMHIGLLDIFGFECFDSNSIEQLCINYANERLQQLYIFDIFKETERLFESEGLKEYYNRINFVDNSSIIEVIDKNPTGVFTLLDDECSVKANDKGLSNSILNTHKMSNVLKKSRANTERFIISHTARDVEYNTNGFCQKNLDEFKNSMKDCVNSIKENLILNMINEEFFSNNNSASSTKGPAKKYLGGKFRLDMNSLIEELKKCSCHYIRCLKPNEDKKADYFVSGFVMQQIKYLGILDTIRIRREGYSVKQTHHLFYSRYEDVVDFDNKPFILDVTENEPKLPEFNQIVIRQLFPKFSCENILFGKNLVFMKQDFFEMLDKIREKTIRDKEKYVTRIIMNFRNKKFRNQFIKLKKFTVLVQSRFKTQKQMRYITLIRKYAVRLQNWWKNRIMIKQFSLFFKRLNLVKAFFRMLKIRIRLTIVARRIKTLKNALLRFKNRMKAIRYERIRNMVWKLVYEAENLSFKNNFLNYLIYIQKNVRGFLYKVREGENYEIVKNKIKEIRLANFSLKIQTYYRMSIIRRQFLLTKKLSEKLKGIFKIIKSKLYIKILRNSSKIIQNKFRRHYYKNTILDEKFNNYNEVEENLLNENNFLNTLTLFPNFSYRVKNQRGSSINTLGKLKFRQKFYEKKLLNYKPELIANASNLKLSPFDEPKLHFFAHILDFDTIVNTDETYVNVWAETVKEIQKHCINNKDPIQSIEVGGMHTSLMNSAGKVYTWGWNGQGQCGYMTNKDKEYKIDLNQLYHIDMGKEIASKELSSKDNEENEISYKRGTFWDFYNVAKPILIDNFSGKQIINGEDFSIILTKEGKMFTFGANDYYQLGIKGKKSFYNPFNYTDYLMSLYKNNEINFDANLKLNQIKILQAKSSGKMNVILTDNGDVILLSHFTNFISDLENNLIKVPKVIKVPSIKFSNIECGKNFCVLLSTTGLVFSFGRNKEGQLGLGDFVDRAYPTEIPKFKESGVKAVQISCGYNHVVIRSSGNKVFTWGCNIQGQLGNNSFINSPYPNVLDYSLNDIKLNILQVSAGLRSTTLLTDSSQIFWCGTAGDISLQPKLIDFDYKTKLPELFTYDNNHIVKIHHTWANSMSVFYAVLADTAFLKIKLKNPQKLKFILNSLSNKWITKDVYPPHIEHVDGYIAMKHLQKTSK